MAFISDDLNRHIMVLIKLNLFKEYSNQVAIEKHYYSESQPISNIQCGNAPVEFNISG